ncbi:preprotein translocase subunit YajC [Botrimarina mediterranea]|uniref:preprotein translocase subunit YajC n=1 Tax=Botrimarina mediterranea TaxID=2528022 RepID=UPI0011A9202E
MIASATNAVSSVVVPPWLLLAQDGGGGAAAPNPLLTMLPLLAMGLLAYFLFIVPQRTKQKQFQTMIDNLKENDRIVTTGGLHGVITSVQRDAGRLTLRVDDTTGAKVRVSLWAVDSIVTDDK